MPSARAKTHKRKPPPRKRSAEVVTLYPREALPNRELAVVYPPPAPIYPPTTASQQPHAPSEPRPNITLIVAAIGGFCLIASSVVGAVGAFVTESMRTRVQAPSAQLALSEPIRDRCTGAETHWQSAQLISGVEAYADHLSKFGDCAFAQLATLQLTQLATLQLTQLARVSAAEVPTKRLDAVRSTSVAKPSLPVTKTGYGDLVVRWKGTDWVMPPKPFDQALFVPCVKAAAPQWC